MQTENNYNKTELFLSILLVTTLLVSLKWLLDKFDVINSKINPDIVILDRNNYFKISKLKDTGFCKIFDNYNFKIYINNNLKYECKLIKN